MRCGELTRGWVAICDAEHRFDQDGVKPLCGMEILGKVGHHGRLMGCEAPMLNEDSREGRTPTHCGKLMRCEARIQYEDSWEG